MRAVSNHDALERVEAERARKSERRRFELGR